MASSLLCRQRCHHPVCQSVRGAIGYVGLAYVSPRVKTLSVSYDGTHYATPTVENAKLIPHLAPALLYYYKKIRNKSHPDSVYSLVRRTGHYKKSGYIPVK